MKYVIYYRVSTKQQGESGLGLEAQERDINLYLKNYVYGKYEVIETITDVKSGKGNLDKRPELKRAVELATKEGAILLVAKLDRLSRDVELIAHLMNRKSFEFKVACMPNAGKFELHLYAALAEQERDFISQRTKAALAEAKARGVKLGGLRSDMKKANKAKAQKAVEDAEHFRREFELLVKHGYTIGGIADCLNEREIKTSRGGDWHRVQVSRMLKRLNLTAVTNVRRNKKADAEMRL